MSCTVLITGANRGLGLEFCRQYLKSGAKVYATCRDPENAPLLSEFRREYPQQFDIIALDVCSQSSIIQLIKTLNNVALDILINNAGVMGPRGQFNFPPVTAEENPAKEWLSVLNTNTVAPIMVSLALLPNLKQGSEKKIVMLGSFLGSIEENETGEVYMYRSSKAGLHSATKSLHLSLSPQGISVVLVHPGWVKTDMGGENAEIGVEVSIAGMRSIIGKAKPEATFQLINYNGESIPW